MIIGSRSYRRRHSYPYVVCILLACAAGISLWAAAAPRNYWPLMLAGLAFFWLAAHRATWGRAFITGTLGGFIYFYLLFDWAQVASGMLVPRAALAGLESLFFGAVALIWAGIWRWVDSKKSAIAVACGLLTSGISWAGMELARSYIPMGGLPWGLSAYSLVDSPLAHLASLGGSELVGAAAVIASISFILALRNFLHLHPVRAIAAACISILIFCLPLALLSTPESNGILRVGIVQGNAPKIGEVSTESWSSITTENHIQAANKILAQQPDILIFPESMSALDYREDPDTREDIQQLARKAGVPLLLGTQKYFERDGRTLRTNDYVIQYPDGTIPSDAETYSKQRPVPFGEYVPYRSFFEHLTTKTDEIPIDMEPGDKPAHLSIHLTNSVHTDNSEQRLTAAVPICFEIAYADIVAEGALGSHFLIVPTSNVTFEESDEAFQQFAITRFRAIETGRAAIQVSTMGTSGVAMPDGKIIYQTELFTQDARIVDIPLYQGETYAIRTWAQRYCITAAGLVFAIVLSARGLQRTRIPRRTQVKSSLASIAW